MPRGQHLLTVAINSTIDRIATARLIYQDGSASAGGFALSSGDLLVPGNSIAISAGDASDAPLLFKGIITRHSLKIRNNAAPQLIVEARHEAVKMTIARRSASYFEQKDSDIVAVLFDSAGIAIEAQPSGVTHQQLVQYQCSDWDFCLARARANGSHLLTRTDGVVLRDIDLSGDASLDLVFGATVLEADFQLEARYQYAATRAVHWDPASQQLDRQDGDEPGISSPGNLTGSDLAAVIGLDARVVQHPQLQPDEASQWASAEWRQAEANRVQGRVKCEGLGSVQVGDIVNLAGMGDRFNGKAFVSGVRHQFDLVQGWKTHLQFGGFEKPEDLVPPMSAPPAAALLPAIGGLQIGVVVSNEDPEREFRVRVRMPLIDSDDQGTWARVACLDAGDQRGSFFRPEIGDEVVLGFLNDDPRAAIVLGMLNSSAKPAPLEGSDDNHDKVIQTRAKMKWAINDERVEMSLETPAGNRLLLSEDQQAIVIEDQHGNTISLNQDGISLKSSKAVKIEAGTDTEVSAQTALSISAGTELKLEGAAGAELSSAAQTAVKGGVIQIN